MLLVPSGTRVPNRRLLCWAQKVVVAGMESYLAQQVAGAFEKRSQNIPYTQVTEIVSILHKQLGRLCVCIPSEWALDQAL